MGNRPVYDVVALLARCGVGVVFLAHGWQKMQVGVTATGRNLDAMGAPFPTAAAVYSTFVELLGGAALILGVALPVAGALLFVDMAGALVFVHGEHGIFLVDQGSVHNGFELVLVLGLAALVFAAGGGGRLTLDNRLFGPGSRRGAPRADEPAREPAGEHVPPATGEQPPSTASRKRSARFRPGRRSAVPAAARKPASGQRSGAAQGSGIGTGSGIGKQPVGPASDETPPARPRLASEIVTDTSRDVIVAGKKDKSPASDTTPVRTRKKQPPRSDT